MCVETIRALLNCQTFCRIILLILGLQPEISIISLMKKKIISPVITVMVMAATTSDSTVVASQHETIIPRIVSMGPFTS